MDVNQQLEYADFEEGYISRYISLADTKAGFSFSLCAGLLAFALARPEYIHRLTNVHALAWLSLATSTFGALCAVAVVFPRLDPSAEGFVFWNSIRQFDSEQGYIHALQNSNLEEVTEARLSHCYALAGVAKRKYRWLRMAILLGIFAALVHGGERLDEQRGESNHQPTTSKRAEPRTGLHRSALPRPPVLPANLPASYKRSGEVGGH